MNHFQKKNKHIWPIFILMAALVTLLGVIPAVSPAGEAAALAEVPSCFPTADFPSLRFANSATTDNSQGDHRIDFDGDGVTDVFSVAPDGTWRFSSGARQPWQTLRQESLPLEALRFGDFDGDGRTDAFTRFSPGGQWRFSPGGSGDWVDLASSTLPLEALRLGNFDDDRRTDVLFRTGGGQLFFVSGGVGEAQPLAFSLFPLNNFRYADLDGDGLTDLFLVGAGGAWFVSNGARTELELLRPGLPGVFDATTLRFGNVDDHPGADVLHAGEDGQWVAVSGGSGEAEPLADLPFALEELRLGDFDGDGHIDVLRQGTSGRWQVSFTIDGRWRLLFPTVESQRGLLTCLSGSTDTDRSSFAPVVSGDGQTVVFISDTDFLEEGIADGQLELWRYDAATETLERLTNSGPDRDSASFTLSTDGQTLFFSSDADLLGEGIPDNQFEIWRYDVTEKRLERLTASGPGRDSFTPALSADGETLFFVSDADFLGEGIPDNQVELWRYDAAAEEEESLIRLTTSTPGREIFSLSVSADGKSVVFVSDADFLGEGIPPEQGEIWHYHVPSKTLTRLTDSGPGRDSDAVALSADGKTVVFESNADLLGEGLPRRSEIWRYDLPTGDLVRLTTSGDGRASIAPALSADGKTVAFESNADFLGEGIPDNQFEIWRIDLKTGSFARLTDSDPGKSNITPALSADGRTVVFSSNADFTGQGARSLEVWLLQDQTQIPWENKLYLPWSCFN